jgi:hypothetical protein
MSNQLIPAQSQHFLHSNPALRGKQISSFIIEVIEIYNKYGGGESH